MAPPQKLNSSKVNGCSNGSVASPQTTVSTSPVKMEITPKNDQPNPRIIPNVLYNIGKTPLIRLNRIPQSLGVECEVCKFRIKKKCSKMPSCKYIWFKLALWFCSGEM